MKGGPDILSRRIREKGYRLTRQRKIVLEELASVDTHPRADQIYQMVRKRIPNVSFGTIYRNLRTLEELGLVTEVQYGQRSSRFDANISSHHHFVCRECERIIDVDTDMMVELESSSLARMGYTIEGYRMQLVGLCPVCRKQARKAAKESPAS